MQSDNFKIQSWKRQVILRITVTKFFAWYKKNYGEWKKNKKEEHNFFKNAADYLKIIFIDL